MSVIYFHFNEHLHASQIQLFAKVVKCMIDDEFSMKNLHLLDCPFPLEANNPESLQELCNNNRYISHFYVSTPQYNDLEYINDRGAQISTLDSNVYLANTQHTFNEFRDRTKPLPFLEIADGLLGSFVGINTCLTFFFLKKADDEKHFSWNENYGPCFFDRDHFSEIRDRASWIAHEQYEGKEITPPMVDTAKCNLMKLIYQCGYLSFWCCLTDVATFPGNTPQENEVLWQLIDFMLKTYANIYIYNLTVENNPIKGEDNIKGRGSAENTTRIKLYFTQEDGVPVLLRLDLPHEDYPYVHINIEENGENKHIRLSADTNNDEYDHVFDNLAYALLQYDFNAADYVHSPVDQDKVIIKDMRYRTALFNYSPCSFFYQILPDNTSISFLESVKQAKKILVELLEMDGFNREELFALTPPDLLELAYKELL